MSADRRTRTNFIGKQRTGQTETLFADLLHTVACFCSVYTLEVLARLTEIKDLICLFKILISKILLVYFEMYIKSMILSLPRKLC